MLEFKIFLPLSLSPAAPGDSDIGEGSAKWTYHKIIDLDNVAEVSPHTNIYIYSVISY